MRTLVRISLALLMALAVAIPSAAQSTDDRVSFTAAVGPSLANVGTTFSTTAGMDVALNDYASVVGEFGVLRRAPFRDASEIAPPAPVLATSPRVNAYHWNGNLKVRPFQFDRIDTYVTGGLGSFTADTIVASGVPAAPFEERRRATDFATNVGAGVAYRINDWIGLGADYRTFFVHRDSDTPRVNRFTAGVTVSLK
jgi:opacity protein-like surface antigen